ncbi:MAG: hypothetical protein ABEI13_04545 [Candidatus Paceibacteria bacterium]
MNKNWLAGIFGGTGTGKSWSALSIAEKIDPSFDASKVVLSSEEFLEGLAQEKWGQGDCLIFDEAGVGMAAKEHMTKKNRIIDQVLQTFRRQNIAVIFTVPSKSNMDKSVRRLLHTYIQTEGIDYINEMNILKWQKMQYNRRIDKIYYHNPRLTKNGVKKMVDTVKLEKPSNDLIEEYEEKRSKFQSEKNKEFYQELIDKKEESSSSKSYNHECNQCGNEWDGRVEDPQACPSCNSRLWDKSDDDMKQEASI